LAAPTGKAAARLTESLRLVMESLSEKGLIADPRIPEAVTLHRLIGVRPDQSTPRHHRENPIPADVIIVDEASMIDLAAMWKLANATAPNTRLILLGDKDQLASVEAGNVFSDLCANSGTPGTKATATNVAVLRRSYRFSAGSGIHRLAECIREGDDKEAITVLETGTFADLTTGPLPKSDALARQLGERVMQEYAGLLSASTPAEALSAFQAFRVLCATKHGSASVEQTNLFVERALAAASLFSPGSD
jgi:exodeoxyribonuclease V alpha subunit